VSASRVIDVTPIVTADAAQKDMTAVADLTDLQCLWFLQEEGDAYRRNGNLAMALKRYQALVNVR
jgi:hypothetical protein